MDSLSLSSVSEQPIENYYVNNKLLLPRKPARRPNPIIKLRRGSAAARIPRKQIEPGNDKEEWITQSEEEHNDKKGKYEPEMSMQKSSKNSSPILNKNRKKKSSSNDKANMECNVSYSSSHVVYIKDMIETSKGGQGSTKALHRSASICEEAFTQFCSREIICPQEHRATLAVKLYGVQAALLSALGNPFDNISQSTTSSRNSSQKLQLSLGQASTCFLPAMIWTGMFIVSFVYTVLVVWSLSFRVPIISMLCLALLYSLSILVATASEFNITCGTFRMNGILFASLGVLGFVLFLLVLVMLVLFASWRRTKKQ